ncbi:MAG: cupredoxin domain-containing protein [Actinomycetota bacterium]
MKVRWFTLALVTALAALSYAPVASTQATPQNATTVTVTMKEFRFVLSKRTVPRGVVTFKLVNKGALPHDFKIAGKKSKMVGRGKTVLFRVTLTKGSKPYLCTVPGHAPAGMKGTLKVT